MYQRRYPVSAIAWTSSVGCHRRDGRGLETDELCLCPGHNHSHSTVVPFVPAATYNALVVKRNGLAMGNLWVYAI